MARVFGSSEGFLKELASHAKEKPKIITAQKYEPEKLSAQEEAAEHARSYWWLGYNWDEIEATLIDMEYPDNVVDSAIAAAKKYATDVLKGPFKGIKEGQYIKLNSGRVGVVDCITPKSVSAFLDEEDEAVQIEESSIDWEATKKLSQAFALRQSAKELMRTAQKDYLIPAQPEEFKQLERVPEGEEKFTTTVKTSPGAPKGWGDYPHEKDVEEVSESIGGMLDQMEAAEERLKEVAEELKIANEMANEVRAKKKELLKEQREVAQNIFAIIGSQKREMDDLQGTFFQKYKNKLVGLRSVMVEEHLAPGVLEELQALKGILESNHPRIFKDVMAALDEYMETNTTITEKLEKSFAVFPPRKKKTGQAWEKIKSWAQKAWDKLRGLSDKLHKETFPAMDETIAAIDTFTEAAAVTASRVKASSVIAKLLSK